MNQEQKTMWIALKNAHREPLMDTSRILVYRQRDRKLVAEMTITRPVTVEVTDLDREIHVVRAFPSKHRASSAVGWPGDRITLHCPVDPDAVRRVHVTRLGGLEVFVRDVDVLEKEELAGALNVWAKLKATRVWDGTVADHVRKIVRVNQDRIWFLPSPELLGLVRAAVGGDFVGVSGALHEGDGYRSLDSFKSLDLYGNLQLTFLESSAGELVVDADIDEAGGLLHLFHVVRNLATGAKTNPYDIHEILTFHQELDTGYRLIV